LATHVRRLAFLVLGVSLAAGCAPDAAIPPAAPRAEDQLRAVTDAAPAADAESLAAIQHLRELRGDLEFDAAGMLVSVDLAGNRASAEGLDLEQLAAIPTLTRLRPDVDRAARRQLGSAAG
jgi:hypothetical protein